jgi:hypothetical protein
LRPFARACTGLVFTFFASARVLYMLRARVLTCYRAPVSTSRKASRAVRLIAAVSTAAADVPASNAPDSGDTRPLAPSVCFPPYDPNMGPTQAELTARRAYVWDCHVRGLSYSETRESLILIGGRPVAESTIAADIKRVANLADASRVEQIERARSVELARLDAIWRAWYTMGTGDPRMMGIPDRDAAVILLRVIDMRRQLLGMDKVQPQQDHSARPLAGLSDADLQARLHALQHGTQADASGAYVDGYVLDSSDNGPDSADTAHTSD